MCIASPGGPIVLSTSTLAIAAASSPVAGGEELGDNGMSFANALSHGTPEGVRRSRLDAWRPCPESRPLRRPVQDLAGTTIKDIAGGGTEPWAGS